MRTTDDLNGAFALLERDAEDYLQFTGPRAAARGPRQRGRRFLAGAAAAVVTVGVAVGAAALYSPRGHNVSGGSATNVCVTKLPAAWNQALRGTVPFAGIVPQPLTVTAGGSVIVQWTDTRGDLRVGRFTPSHSIEPLARIPMSSGSYTVHSAANDHYAVTPLFHGRHIVAIDLVDLSNGRITPLLPRAPFARHAQVSPGSWLTIQHGTVYWPASRTKHSAPNVLISYNIASRSYSARQVAGPAVYLNPLGIYWQGGHLANGPLPPAHPAFGTRMTSASDGTAISWSSDDRTIHWSDLDGATRTLQQHLSHFLGVDGVAGPYVFFDRGEGDDTDQLNGNVHVLDTRTGAIADTHTQAWWTAVSRHGTMVFATMIDKSSKVHVVDTTKLPELTCK